ncbi:MAG: protein phosphatase 2C domain-containing protein [Bacteroidota bacterium]|nr:protein phosphatase 2C domain-containing protein [Bacteroidota bacterium]
MKISSYTSIGKRENNEDFIAFNDFVFTLCDGVGGIAKGEVASRFVGDSVIRKAQGINRTSFSVEWVQKIIGEIQDKLNKSITENPENYGMGTTLCAVFISDKEVLLAHIGDSRIYVVKPSEKKYWRSTDHSTVEELVQSGIINNEEAKNHSRRNQITRAIQANSGGEVSKADISALTKVESGDLIFMCSDGVLEAYNDSEIVDILCDTALEINKKLELIKLKCLSVSSDNHSAILLEFEDDDQINLLGEDKLNWIYRPVTNNSNMDSMANNLPDFIYKGNSGIGQKSDKLNKVVKIALYTFAILFVAFLTLTMLKK